MLEAQRHRPKNHQPYRFESDASRQAVLAKTDRKSTRQPARAAFSDGQTFYERMMEFHAIRRQEQRD